MYTSYVLYSVDAASINSGFPPGCDFLYDVLYRRRRRSAAAANDGNDDVVGD